MKLWVCSKYTPTIPPPKIFEQILDPQDMLNTLK